jgi:hypothetical protein
MRQATEALGVAALSPPLQNDTSSVWPEMQRRIATQGIVRPSAIEDSSRLRRPVWARIERTFQNWHSPEGDDGRLRVAWLGDEIRETIDAAFAAMHFGARLRFGLIAGSGLVAILSTWFLLVPAVQQREAAVPAELVGPPLTGVAETAEHFPSSIENDNSSEGSLAQAEPVRMVEAAAPPVPEPAPVAKAASPPTRFNYDLEHGTPMPPDSRDPKPVY